jgi:hypothetical protein
MNPACERRRVLSFPGVLQDLINHEGHEGHEGQKAKLHLYEKITTFSAVFVRSHK